MKQFLWNDSCQQAAQLNSAQKPHVCLLRQAAAEMLGGGLSEPKTGQQGGWAAMALERVDIVFICQAVVTNRLARPVDPRAGLHHWIAGSHY